MAEIPQRSLDQQLTLAETRAKRLTLYAPIDGRVLNVRVRPGEEVGAGRYWSWATPAACVWWRKSMKPTSHR